MNQRSRTIRLVGSVIFISAGLFYIFAPPISTARYFETTAMSITDGIVFTIGGAISAYGVLWRRLEIERLGVALVCISGIALTIIQASVMLELPVTWTRGGGTFVYIGFTIWAIDRWLYIGDRVKEMERAIELTDRAEIDAEGDTNGTPS